MGTVRQDRANPLNALRSTGPKSPAGKDQVSRNALKHGLSGRGVALLPDDAEAVTRRTAEWNSSLRPINPYEFWLTEQIALESLRIERCQELERTLRTRGAERATLGWDEDRGLAAALLGTRLGSKPALVSGQLRQTKQGCDWLLGRRVGLGAVLLEGRDWDEAQRALALDLLGTPLELRTGTTAVDAPAGVGDIGAFRLELVREEIDGLERLRATVLEVLDEREQAAAARGLPSEPDRATARARRYEAACMRRLQWAIHQLQAGRHASGPAAPLPECAGPPAPSPAVAPVVPEGAGCAPMATEVSAGGTGRNEVEIEAETRDAARVEVEAEAETRAAVPVASEVEAEGSGEVPPAGEDAPRFDPAPIGPASRIASGGPGLVSAGSSGRVPRNRRARRAAEAQKRGARR